MDRDKYKRLLGNLLNDAFVPLGSLAEMYIDCCYENRHPPFMVSRKFIKIYYRQIQEQYEESISLTLI